MFSSRQLLRMALPLYFITSSLVLPAWGQAASSVDQQFAAYHDTLAGAAAELLSEAARPVLVPGTVAQAPSPADSRKNFSTTIRRVERLRPLFEPILREEGVPADMAAVVLVESGGQPAARSPRGALGLWQLMPDTARRYGLIVSPTLDERLDLNKATRAAARYLADLHLQFGDWKLAFAAYNAGEQAVQRAIARSRRADFEFISNFLPTETRAYVPAVLSARSLFNGTGAIAPVRFEAARQAKLIYAGTQAQD